MDDTLSITLRFGSWTLPMTIRRDEEIYYRQAEKLIKERFGFYTSSYPGQSSEMYLVMTVLDIALQSKRQEAEGNAEPVLQLLRPLLAEVETALDKKNEK
ncbi:MAG: cell division protein ZapA [Bacteroidaceae bacterium]|nr:cell division protein ZapA [Bacteroidaceae bacterium]